MPPLQREGERRRRRGRGKKKHVWKRGIGQWEYTEGWEGFNKKDLKKIRGRNEMKRW